ncbi:MAG: serine hydroxymethyltransferase, partial [Proteobacteria bacterium]|nr:serine hydroxymethyltransferase [Pseudomonadota bacterium]
EACSGKDAEDALGRVEITVNKNTVPGEKRSPFVASGIRIGTPAMTTRGMGVEASVQIANWIADTIENRENDDMLQKIRQQVVDMCQQFPVYPEHLIH